MVSVPGVPEALGPVGPVESCVLVEPGELSVRVEALVMIEGADSVDALVTTERAETVDAVAMIERAATVDDVVRASAMSWSIWGFFEGMGRRVWRGSTVTGGRSE
jgi:hypothetical protein